MENIASSSRNSVSYKGLASKPAPLTASAFTNSAAAVAAARMSSDELDAGTGY
ncbi:hypothetical protein A2U01_0117905, partial [Trifolium medium]|nr:hypothetical protein [Trifolium medium]